MNLEDRVANLEAELAQHKRRARRARWAPALAIGVCLIMFGLFEATTDRVTAQGKGYEDEIRTRKFVLVNESGERRASMDVSNNDQPNLLLFGKNEQLRVELNLDNNDDPWLALYGKDGMARTSLGVFKEKSGLGLEKPGLGLYDKNGKPRVSLGIFKEKPGIIFFDRNGKITWSQSSH